MRKKSFKSALTVLLSLMMILVMFPANAFAMDGEGTKENPYEIATASELYEFATKVNAGNNTACAVLTADIDMTDEAEWTPIGDYDAYQYTGTFDGGGHTITGLSVDIKSDNDIYAGLFGCLGAGGTIKNVSLTDSKITCSGNRVYVGGVCGWNTGTIQNCYNTGDVSGTSTSSYGYVYAGGVCGWNTGTIENCYNTGDVSGTSTSSYGYVYAGGVCGWNDFGTIENCYNTGEVSGTGTSSYGYVYAGGVCGLNTGTIENCYNTGDVSGTSSYGYVYAGGVCGRNTGTIQNCYFLFGTTDNAVGNSTGTVNRVEEKSAEAFASGEVAWLLNQGQTGTPWGQGSNNMPVLEGNLPAGVTSYVPVRITIVMTDNTQKSYYSAKGSTFTEYPTGYAFFFKDGDTKTWISKGTQTYDADATIYAENMPLEKIQAKAPTCTEKGNSAYWYSAAFDKYFKDENGVNEITAESTVIPAKGHGESEVKGAKEATCTEEGYTGDKVCKVCGEILERGTVIEKLGHVWGEPEWNWSEDGKTCKVTFTCENNPEHKETPEVTVTSAVKTPASCTELGITEYTATVVFNGVTYTDTKEIVDIQATGHDFDNGKCTACGEIDPEFKAVIIEGANGEWQKGAKDGLSFTSNAAFAHFLKVQVDGKDLDASDYTVKEGSTIVTLNAEYLETLSVGKHTLAIVSETGTAETEFTITAAPTEDTTTKTETTDTTAKNTSTKSPATGNEASMAAPAVFASICGLAISLILISKKRRNTVK